MLGHEAMRVLAPDFEVWGACRSPEELPDLGVPRERLLGGLDATDPQSAYALVERVRPDFVLNAVGIVKQRADAKAAIPSIAGQQPVAARARRCLRASTARAWCT